MTLKHLNGNNHVAFRAVSGELEKWSVEILIQNIGEVWSISCFQRENVGCGKYCFYLEKSYGRDEKVVYTDNTLLIVILQTEEWWRETTAVVTEFILLGVTQSQDAQLLVFVLVLFFYLIILPENFPIILTIRWDPGLTAPLYFFLGNVAFLDAPYSFIVAPKMLVDLPSEKTVNLLSRLPHSALFLALPGSRGNVSSCCDGLWPLHRHMSSFTLFNRHEP